MSSSARHAGGGVVLLAERTWSMVSLGDWDSAFPSTGCPPQCHPGHDPGHAWRASGSQYPVRPPVGALGTVWPMMWSALLCGDAEQHVKKQWGHTSRCLLWLSSSCGGCEPCDVRLAGTARPNTRQLTKSNTTPSNHYQTVYTQMHSVAGKASCTVYRCMWGAM